PRARAPADPCDAPARPPFYARSLHDALPIFLRTFSKAYGLAGLRIGYLVAHPVVAEAIRKTFLPFSVNSVAQAAGVASLAATDELLERVEGTVKERDNRKAHV